MMIRQSFLFMKANLSDWVGSGSGLPRWVFWAVVLAAAGGVPGVGQGQKASAPLEASIEISPIRLAPQSTIEVVFPTSMVKPEAVGKEAAESPVVAEPVLAGVFEWTSSRSGHLRLTQVPRFGQKYTFRLRPGLTDLEGRALSTEVLVEVSTDAFKVVDQDPKWFDQDDLPRTRPFLFQFNDQVNAVDAAAHFQFRSHNPPQVIPAKVRHATGTDLRRAYSDLQPTWTEQVGGVEPKVDNEEKRLSALVVEPAELLPAAADWELVISGSLGNSAGQARLGQEQIVKLGTVQPLAVESVTGRTPFDRPYYVEVVFTKSLRRPEEKGTAEQQAAAMEAYLSALAKQVVIEPEVAGGTKVEVASDTLRLSGQFELGSEYRVTVVPGIEAWDGLKLEEAVAERVVTFEPNPPYLAAPAFARSQMARGEGVFEITAANVTRVRVRAKRLTGPQLVEALELYRSYNQAFERKLEKRRQHKPKPIEQYPGEWALDREYVIEKPLDQSEVIRLEWKELLAAQDGAGALVLEMEGTGREGLEDKRVLTQSILTATDLGILHKTSGKDHLVMVTHLESGKPAAGARVTLLDRERKLVGHGQADAQGVARIAAGQAVYVLAELGADSVVLDAMGDAELWGLYGYEITRTWRDVWRPLRKTFVFSDRSLYRPEDTVHVKALTRLQTGDALALEGRERQARLRLRDAKYRLIRDEPVTFSVNGSLTADLKLPEGPLGGYSLEVAFPDLENEDEGDEDEGSGGFLYFRVDDYRPNTFEVAVETERAVVKEERLEVPVTARYYMGKALSQAKVAWHAFSEPDFEVPAEWSAYHFGEAPDWAGYGEMNPAFSDVEEDPARDWFVSGDLDLSADGEVVLDLPRPPAQRSALPQRVRVQAEVTDINQQTVTVGEELRVPGAAVLPGIRGPDGFGTTGSEVALQLIGIDASGAALASPIDGEVVVERQHYQTVKVQTAGGGTTTETQSALHEVKRATVKVGGQPSDFVFTPEQSGAYFVTLTLQDAQGVKAYSRLPLFVLGRGDYPWLVEDEMRLTLQPEKKTVKPGQEAVIAVHCPIAGTALVTVERNRVHQHWVQPFSPENPLVRIPIGEADAPNVYVSVVVMRGAAASGKQKAMPEFRAGYVELEVPSDALELAVEIQPEKDEVLPGSQLPVTVVVRDAKGAPMPGADVTLFAVDEGVLSLTGHETPDAGDFFHTPFPLAFSNFASLENLLPEESGERVRENKGFLVGGGGEEGEALPPTRKNFVATPLWLGSALTDAEGRITASIAVPDNLTRYRLMSVVTAGAERFGKGESAFTVNKPLMVEPVVPRFARLGDEVLVKAVVHNTTAEGREVEVVLQLDGGAAFITEARPFSAATLAGGEEGKQTRKVTVPAGATVSSAFPVRFEKTGETIWQWQARTIGAGDALMDAVESRFQVEHPVPELREVHHARLIADGTALKGPEKQLLPETKLVPKGTAKAKAKSGAKGNQAPEMVKVKSEPAGPRNLLAGVKPVLLENEGSVKVSLTTTRLTELGDALDYLLQYPYGCVEQTTSATMPWLALGGYHSLYPRQLGEGKAKEAIQRGVNRLLQMVVDGEGGLAYWPGGTEPSAWGSAYGGLLMLRARDAGALVPEQVVDELMDYLSKSLRGLDAATDAHMVSDAALALYALAKAKRPEPAYHALLYERRARLPEAAKLYLALAILISDGPEEQVKQLIGVGTDGGLTKAASGNTARHWAGDGPNRALRLLACTHLGLNKAADALAEAIWAERNLNGEWGNTYTNAWTLTALTAYERSRKASGQPVRAELVWGGERQMLELTTGQFMREVVLPLSPARSAQPLLLKVNQGDSAWVRTEVRARPKARDFAGENHGYGITREYALVQADGTLTAPENLRVGDLVQVSLGIEIGGGDRYLAIEDPLPAVFEPVNPEFESQNARPGDVFEGYEPWFCDHRELRADRGLFFTDHAPERGRFVLHYLVRVVAEGDTVAPPAKIEAMYEPSRYGLSRTQRVITLPSGNAKVAGTE